MERKPLLGDAAAATAADPAAATGAAKKTGGSGTTAAFVQLLQGNLGPGILTLPFIFTIGGVVITSVMLALVLLLTLYSMGLVLHAKAWLHKSSKWINVEDERRPQSFQAIGKELLGSKGEKVIICFVVMMQLGITMVFLNFAAENMIAVEHYFQDKNFTCIPREEIVIPDGEEPELELPFCDIEDTKETAGYIAAAVLVATIIEVVSIGFGVKLGLEPLGVGIAMLAGAGTIGLAVGVMSSVGEVSKPELVFACAPLALALSLGRSPMITVISASGATTIMYTAVGTIFVLVGWHFVKYFPGTDAIQVTPAKPYELPIVFGNLVYVALLWIAARN